MIQELNQEASNATTPDTELSKRATLRNILSLVVLGLPLEGTYEQQQMAFLLKHLLVRNVLFIPTICIVH